MRRPTDTLFYQEHLVFSVQVEDDIWPFIMELSISITPMTLFNLGTHWLGSCAITECYHQKKKK